MDGISAPLIITPFMINPSQYRYTTLAHLGIFLLSAFSQLCTKRLYQEMIYFPIDQSSLDGPHSPFSRRPPCSSLGKGADHHRRSEILCIRFSGVFSLGLVAVFYYYCIFRIGLKRN
ncbi:hypothetical protein M426DRAFT_149292 [Hypoxylon sp. CI-4A]|nr:hypothetical protein M426DRAFT_149292 [Hypoxylon sp. CI-4A]